MEKSKQIVSPRNPFNWMPEIELKELGVCKHPKPADKTSIGYDCMYREAYSLSLIRELLYRQMFH